MLHPRTVHEIFDGITHGGNDNVAVGVFETVEDPRMAGSGRRGCRVTKDAELLAKSRTGMAVSACAPQPS